MNFRADPHDSPEVRLSKLAVIVAYFIGVTALFGLITYGLIQGPLAELPIWETGPIAIGYVFGILLSSAVFCRFVPLGLFLRIAKVDAARSAGKVEPREMGRRGR